MMHINRNNYEAYLLDLLEGRLSSEEQQAVRDFLVMNPDCTLELNVYESWELETGKVSYRGKAQLKKEFPDSASKLTYRNFDLFSIARLEGDLTREQLVEHHSMVSEDNKWRQEWEEWEKTRLVGEQIIFPGKDQLKKKERYNRRGIWINVISSAAVIALLIGLLRMEPAIPAMELTGEGSSMQTSGDENRNTKPSQTADLPSHEIPKIEKERIASEPVILSIKKHQDPTELTGIRSDSKKSDEKSDTVTQKPIQQILPGPIQVAGLDKYREDLINTVTYDRILPLEIPPSSIHITSLSISQMANLDLQELLENYAKEKNISLWSIANAGIQGINRITGTDMSLLASRDDEGYVSGFQFRSKRFSFVTPIDRTE